MRLKEFVNEVANSDILNDQELRILFTYLNGGQPKTPMPFTDQVRGSPMEKVRFQDISVEKFNVNLPEGVSCSVKIESLEASHALQISEVDFINPADFPFDILQIVDANTITKADDILKITGEEFESFPVYKAVFKKPVCLTSQFHIYLKTSTYSGTAPSVRIIGNSNNYQTIHISSNQCSLVMEHDRKYSTVIGKNGSHAIFWAQKKDAKSWHFFIGFKGRIV